VVVVRPLLDSLSANIPTSSGPSMDISQRTDDLVSTTWLADHLNDPTVRIVDVRWYLDGRSGADAYAASHIPSAVFVDVERDLAARPSRHAPGRHPLPSPDAFADTLARLGIGPTTRVVAYDDEGGSRAARFWWMLRYFGHGGGSVLDGGWTQWLAESKPTVATVRRVTKSPPMELVALPRFVVDKRRIAELMASSRVCFLDVRTPERYAGVVEPIDPRPGHIPGAINAPYTRNLLAPGGLFRSPHDLRQYFHSLGINETNEIIVYCGSGITACHTLLALHMAGFQDTKLYEGSWSDWSLDTSLSAHMGSTP